MIDAKTKQAYLKNPNFCPKCKSKSITGEGFNADGDYVWQGIVCDACGFEWEDIYTLTDVEEKA